MTLILDDQILDRLDAVLAAQPGELLKAVGAEVPEAKVRAAFRDLPVTPSEEVIRWLTRHEWNGVWALPGIQTLALDVVVVAYSVERDLAVRAAGYGGPNEDSPLASPDLWWSPDWLSLFGLGGLPKLAVDCANGPTAPSPVRFVAWDGAGAPNYAEVITDSLGEYVENACQVLESGRYHYDPAEAQWMPMDWASLPIVERFARGQ
jgi:cell wall assembly regulator SMI1